MPHTRGIHERTPIPLGQARWVKVLLVLLLLIPPISAQAYDPAQTGEVIQGVLAQPLVSAWPVLFPITKFALLAVVIVCLVSARWMGPLGWGAYAGWLAVVAFGQSMAVTDRWGFVWVLGNTVVMLAVAALAAADVLGGRSRFRPGLRRERLWMLPLMAFAWLYPYAWQGDHIVAGLGPGTLGNEAGLTYCMLTPVFLGLMMLRHGVHKPTLALASWVGLVFGLLNLVTFFVINPASWWMGVLHLPLAILAAFGVWVSKRSPRRHLKGL